MEKIEDSLFVAANEKRFDKAEDAVASEIFDLSSSLSEQVIDTITSKPERTIAILSQLIHQKEEEKPLPCPFCGGAPTFGRHRMNAELILHCINEGCAANPSIVAACTEIENKGDSQTFSVVWEDGEKALTKAWNTRA